MGYGSVGPYDVRLAIKVFPSYAATVGYEFRCKGRWAEVAPGVGECSRGFDCDALELFQDFEAYRLAHQRWRRDPESYAGSPSPTHEPEPDPV